MKFNLISQASVCDLSIAIAWEQAEKVASCMQLAMLLEVSAYPKPGNVHRTADVPDTNYEQFLASIASMHPRLERVAVRAGLVMLGKTTPKEIEIGLHVKELVENMVSWQYGGNTHLGSIMLLLPVAAAGGMCLTKGDFSIGRLRERIDYVVKSTTPKDAVNVYDAILAAKPAGLGRVDELDVHDPRSKGRILGERIPLYRVFEMAADHDSIAKEWATNYRITFDVSHPYFEQERKKLPLNSAIINTFLRILSEVPDTFVVGEFGRKKAEEVSTKASKILKAGGMATKKGAKAVWGFDGELRKRGINPGTTADLVAAAIAVSALSGFRP